MKSLSFVSVNTFVIVPSSFDDAFMSLAAALILAD